MYSSAPRHGVSAAAAGEVLAGERRALEERDGRAGGLRIRLRQLPATDERGRPWDPALVAENAHRAADDPTAIAYLGELDYGATAVSLPITNNAGLLQVSPGDGLTSLTQRPPGRPRAGPERYYPTGSAQLRARRADRPERGGAAGRAPRGGRRQRASRSSSTARSTAASSRPSSWSARAAPGSRRSRPRSTAGASEDIPDIARSLAEKRPEAVVHLGVAGAATLPMLSAIGDQLPGVPVFAASGMLAVPGLALRPAPEQSRRSVPS